MVLLYQYGDNVTCLVHFLSENNTFIIFMLGITLVSFSQGELKLRLEVDSCFQFGDKTSTILLQNLIIWIIRLAESYLVTSVFCIIKTIFGHVFVLMILMLLLSLLWAHDLGLLDLFQDLIEMNDPHWFWLDSDCLELKRICLPTFYYCFVLTLS